MIVPGFSTFSYCTNLPQCVLESSSGEFTLSLNLTLEENNIKTGAVRIHNSQGPPGRCFACNSGNLLVQNDTLIHLSVCKTGGQPSHWLTVLPQWVLAARE
jgi:hypothetical protein